MARDVKTFWGGLLGATSAMVTLVPAIVAGTYKEVSGTGSFQDGVDSVIDPVFDTVSQFGDDHSDKITGAVITMAGSVAADRINKANKK